MPWAALESMTMDEKESGRERKKDRVYVKVVAKALRLLEVRVRIGASANRRVGGRHGDGHQCKLTTDQLNRP